jgi:hypothetical protein
MRIRRKVTNGTKAWERMSSDVRAFDRPPLCAFYTPAGRMVTRPHKRRPSGSGLSNEEWCAYYTPFKNQAMSRKEFYKRKRR